MLMVMRITTTMLVLTALLLLLSAAASMAAARPLDSSGWPQEALAALEASCDGCFDPMAAVEAEAAARSDWLDPPLLDVQPGHGISHGDSPGTGEDKEQGQRFMLLTNLEVPSSIRSTFELRWRLAAKQSNTTEGLVIARLHRSVSHNKHYHIYDEWESKGAFLKHMVEDRGRRMFTRWCEDNDITVEPVRLGRISVYIAEDQHSSLTDGEETPPADVIRFTVKPSQMDDFQSAAKALTEAVAQKEVDNLELSFATAADTDFLAYVYAQWRTPEGIEKHLSAQHTLKFLDHVKERDILAERSWWVPLDEWKTS